MAIINILNANNSNFLATQISKARDHGLIVSKPSITFQFVKVSEDMVDLGFFVPVLFCFSLLINGRLLFLERGKKSLIIN